MEDLKRWIWDDFTDQAEWREMPSHVEIAPGVVVTIPVFEDLPPELK